MPVPFPATSSSPTTSAGNCSVSQTFPRRLLLVPMASISTGAAIRCDDSPVEGEVVVMYRLGKASGVAILGRELGRVACRRRARGGERARRTFTRPGTAVTTPATASVMLGRLGEYKALREWYTTYVASTQQDLKRSGRKKGRGAELGSQGEVIGARRV